MKRKSDYNGEVRRRPFVRQVQIHSQDTGFIDQQQQKSSPLCLLPKEIVLHICHYFDSTEDLFSIGLISKELRRKCSMTPRELTKRLEFIYLNTLRNMTLPVNQIRYVRNILDGTDLTCMIAAIRAMKVHFKYIPGELINAARDKARELINAARDEAPRITRSRTTKAIELVMFIWTQSYPSEQIRTAMLLAEICEGASCWDKAIGPLETIWNDILDENRELKFAYEAYIQPVEKLLALYKSLGDDEKTLQVVETIRRYVRTTPSSLAKIWKLTFRL
jgi:hypothetical protein